MSLPNTALHPRLVLHCIVPLASWRAAAPCTRLPRAGGQKKRTTLGEQCVGPRNIFLLDEISTGLDSETTTLIVRCLRNMVHMTQVRCWPCTAAQSSGASPPR